MIGEFTFDAVVERLKAALGLRSDSSLAEALGMSSQAFANRKKTGSLPYDEIIAIAVARGLDVGAVLVGPAPGRNGAGQDRRAYLAPPVETGGGFVEVPLYDVRAAAGFGAFAHDEPVVESLAFRRDWIDRQFGAQARDLCLIYVAGDSMEPALSDGDVIMIDRAQNKVRADGVYVLRYDDSLVVKKLQRLPGGMIRIFSENAEYSPATISAVDLDRGEGAQVVGRVVWGARKF